MSKSTTFVIPDQSERDFILHQLDTTILVEAAAGTGKTTSMIGRMTALIREGKCTIDQLAAVTFTRKAAGELRSRFQIELEKAAQTNQGEAKQRLQTALVRIEQCFIGTIHSFCGRLLRERPVEAGVDVSFHEMDDTADQILRERVWEEFTATLIATDHPDLTRLQDHGLGIHQLKNAFLKLADYPDVEEWPVDQMSPIAWAPTRNALSAYLDHIADLEPTLPKDTASDKLIPRYRLILRLSTYYDLDIPSQLMEIMELFSGEMKLVQKVWPDGKEQALEEKQRWEQFGEQCVEPIRRQWLAARYALVMGILQRALALYDQRRQETGGLNFQDLLMKTASLLKRNPAVRRYFQKQITHLLVDEFQDTDPIQAEILLYLTGDNPEEPDWRRCQPAPGSLFVVGDPKQSIYRFRRADIVTYNLVKQIVLASGGHVLSLRANFRTVPSILDWVNQAFDPHFPPQADDYSPQYVPFVPGKPGSDAGKTRVWMLETPEEETKKASLLLWESEQIAFAIRNALNRGVPPGDFMIVTWNTKQLNVYSEALQRLAIPYQVSGGSALNQGRSLELLRLCLHAVLQPDHPIALVALLRSELFGFADPLLFAYKQAGGRYSFLAKVPEGQDFTSRFDEVYQRLKKYDKWVRRLPLPAAIERMVDDIGLFAWAAAQVGGNEEAGNLAKAIELIRAAQSEFATILDVLNFVKDLIDKTAAYDSLPSRPYDSSVVRLMNLHKVKGLEAAHVYLANPTGKMNHPVDLHVDRSSGRVRGYVAIQAAGGFRGKELATCMDWPRIAKEEERYHQAEQIRLLYVAATRAKNSLIISLKKAKSDKSNNKNYWGFFEEALNACPRIQELPTQPIPMKTPVSVNIQQFELAMARVIPSWQSIVQPSYAMESVKAATVEDQPFAGESDPYGQEWGTVIHILLERLMSQPGADIRRLAETFLHENGVPLERLDEAIETAQRVTASAIWKRAQQSAHIYTEIPFYRLAAAVAGSVPVMKRGVMDLIFKEPTGWVIVDYKTDLLAKTNPSKLIKKYRPQLRAYAQEWQILTGEAVIETGLFFIRTSQYEPVA